MPAHSMLDPFLSLWPLLLLLVAVKVIAGISSSPAFKGWFGEMMVVRAGLRELDPTRYRHFHDLYLRHPDGHGTTQIDHVVVSPFGIFVIDASVTSLPHKALARKIKLFSFLGRFGFGSFLKFSNQLRRSAGQRGQDRRFRSGRRSGRDDRPTRNPARSCRFWDCGSFFPPRFEAIYLTPQSKHDLKCSRHCRISLPDDGQAPGDENLAWHRANLFLS